MRYPGRLGSVVDPKLFFLDPDPTLTLILDPDSNPDPVVYEKYIRNSDDLNIAKKARLFRKINLNCRSSKHCKKN
jgi:hypothetical protein